MDSGCDTNGSKHSNQSDSLVWWIIPFYAKDWGQAWFSWAKKASRSFSRDWHDIYIRENSWTSFWRLETLEVVFDFFVETEFGCSYVICLWIQLQCYWCGLQHISDTDTFSPCLLQTSQLLPLSRTLFVWFQVSTGLRPYQQMDFQVPPLLRWHSKHSDSNIFCTLDISSWWSAVPFCVLAGYHTSPLKL